jgi:hypothetical protein
MTLKEKFEEIDIEMNDSINGTWLGCMSKIEVEQCVAIADDYAIEFTEWLCDYEITKEQLKTRLEIFKKERGL